MTTKKQMKEAIKNYQVAMPNGEISTGIYISKIGHKYVTLLNTYESSTEVKIYIEDFYKDNCNIIERYI